MDRPRILFLSNDLKPKRGGNALTAWMLQAIASDYQVTVLSWLRPDMAALDRRFGTELARSSFEFVCPGAVERWLVEHIPDQSEMQCCNYLLRYAKRMARDFATVIACTSLECDLGVPGIQYVHYPYLAKHTHLFDTPGDAPLPGRVSSLIRGRLAPWMIISGYSYQRMRENLTLTNSEWTRDVIRRDFSMDSQVVYPPAEGAAFSAPWEEREDGFVCIGWFEEPKRQDWVIETLAEVRRQHPGLRLHLCGTKWPSPYLNSIETLARREGSWIQIHYDLSNHDLLTLVGRQKYGIHAMVGEHFGIAPAMCARAGCIPFVHSSGGQVEIVDRNPRLCFTTREEAMSRILAVLGDRALQDELRASVQARSDRFSAQTFAGNIRHHVAEFIARRA